MTSNDIICVDINALSGWLDACLDGLGHTDVSSLPWLREAAKSIPAAQPESRPAVAASIEALIDERNSAPFNAALRLSVVRTLHPDADPTQYIDLIASHFGDS